MSQSTAIRLIWKEYRLQRAFWIALVVLAAMLMLFGWSVVNRHDELVKGLFYIALGTPVFYVLGSASTTFAGEHDADTYQFQRSQPVAPNQVFWCKVIFSFVSTLAMFAVLWLLAYLLAGRELPPGESRSTLGMMGFRDASYIAGMVAWLYLIWGIFFSLIQKRPLLAVILTVTVGSMGAYIISAIIDISFPRESMLPLNIYAGVTLFVAMLDLWLAKGWFRETKRRVFGPKQVENSRKAKPHTLVEYLSQPNAWTMMQRLSWQHWRQSRWIGIMVLVMLTPLILTFFIFLFMYKEIKPSGPPPTIVIPLYVSGLLFSVAMPTFIGAFTFLADQQQRHFRFFAERGIHPRKVWLSRLWPWPFIITIVYALPVIIVIAYWLSWIDRDQNIAWLHEWHTIFMIIGYLFDYTILGLSVGQLCSMFFRSGLLAGLFSIILTAILTAWAALMWLWGLNWLWSVAPIPVLLLYATWLRAPDWILERRTFASWLRPALALVLPAIIILTAVPLCRMDEFPVVNAGISSSDCIRPLSREEQATLDIYKHAWFKYSEYPVPKTKPKDEEADQKSTERKLYDQPDPLSKDDLAWIAANQEVIPLAIEASKGPEGVFTRKSLMHSFDNPADYAWRVHEIGKLLILNARKLESDGKLDDALDQYLAAVRIARQIRISGVSYGEAANIEYKVYFQLPFWAAEPDQTPEQIKKAIKELEKLTTDLPTESAEIKYEYLQTREYISTGLKNYPGKDVPPATFLWLKLPWERVRALRLLDVLAKRDMEKVAEAETAARNDKAIPVDIGADPYRQPRYYPENEDYPYALQKTVFVPPIHYFSRSENIIEDFAEMENIRRKTRTILALQGWKLEHGEYPKILNELSGTYLSIWPVDPYTGESYQYFPSGLKLDMPGIVAVIGKSPIKDKPFIWSGGPLIKTDLSKPDILNGRYKIFEYEFGRPYYTGLWRKVRTEYELYSHGHFSLVP
jgi:hypothetical protein